ncbi:MAG: polyprenol monophosphomannose synthase [Bifidobacteriaceae bacterium]|nr:polyprenol monophosphomannose synthase [Bifidobacteriaceae bacterium]
MSDKIVVFPTYNELESLPVIVAKVRRIYPILDILVVDDSSPDGTGQLADQMSKELPNFYVLHRTEKAGLGAAYIEAFQWCIEKGYKIVIQMDVDGSHRPEDLPKLIDKIESDRSIDLVIGSRYIKGGKTQGWSKPREILSRGGNFWSRMMMKLPIKDATAGFRAYRTRALKDKIKLNQIDSKGFGFQIDMTEYLYSHKGNIVEVPITFVERTLGESKMDKKIVWEALKHTTKKGITLRKIHQRRNYA